MADPHASLNSYNRPAPLDAPAGALIVALRAAPEGHVLWVNEGDALWIARNTPRDVLLRAGDLLRIPHVDFYNKISLAEEVTRVARGPAIAARAGSYLGHRERELNAVERRPLYGDRLVHHQCGPVAALHTARPRRAGARLLAHARRHQRGADQGWQPLA